MRLLTLLVPLLASIQAIGAVPVENNAAAAAVPTLVYRRSADTSSLAPTLSRELNQARAQTSSTTTTATISTSSSTTSSASSSSTACVGAVKPDKNGYVPPDQCNAMYDYYPSFRTAVAFTVLFGILLGVHLVQGFTYKTKFCWVVIMGVAWEFGGYLTRAFSTKHQQSEGLATITQLLVLLAPLWVNAFDYMVLARMIWFFHPEKRIWFFKPSVLAIMFVCLDFFSFCVQAAGGMMASPGSESASTVKLGLHIYMGGIGIQEFFILVFFVLAIQFHREMLQLERTGGVMRGDKAQWKGLLYSLYFSLVAISVRIIYRLIEYSSGAGLNNPITTHEWFMYVFDAVPMMFATGVWCVLHPGRILRGPDAKLPSSGLGRILCCGYCCHGCACCCKGRRKDKASKKARKGKGMEMLPNNNPYDEELQLRPGDYDGTTGGHYARPRSESPVWEQNAGDIGYEPYRSQRLSA